MVASTIVRGTVDSDKGTTKSSLTSLVSDVDRVLPAILDHLRIYLLTRRISDSRCTDWACQKSVSQRTKIKLWISDEIIMEKRIFERGDKM